MPSTLNLPKISDIVEESLRNGWRTIRLMLSDAEIDAYLEPMDAEQSAAIRAMRSLIVELNPDLVEEIDTGKWFRGLLTYHTGDKIFVFALGPLTGGYTTFHSMAYYGSTALQERHGAALKKFLSGKSCMKFKNFADLPEAAIRDIAGSTSSYMQVAREIFAKRKKK